MAVKISALGAAGALTGEEVIPMVQSGTTVKVTTQAIKEFAQGNVIVEEITTTEIEEICRL